MTTRDPDVSAVLTPAGVAIGEAVNDPLLKGGWDAHRERYLREHAEQAKADAKANREAEQAISALASPEPARMGVWIAIDASKGATDASTRLHRRLRKLEEIVDGLDDG